MLQLNNWLKVSAYVNPEFCTFLNAKYVVLNTSVGLSHYATEVRDKFYPCYKYEILVDKRSWQEMAKTSTERKRLLNMARHLQKLFIIGLSYS